MEAILIQAGLTKHQARGYLFLLEHGQAAPPEVAKKLSLTRSNAYKILDSLVELRLVSRTEIKKKFVYHAEDPIALANLIADERNRVIALEHSVKDAMQGLQQTFRLHNNNQVHAYTGKPAIMALYEDQATRRQPIHFIKTRADIPMMGYENMRYLRHLPGKLGTPRFGITADSTEAALNPAIDRRTNLTRTWIDEHDYTAPVEWSVSGDELLITCFEGEPSAIRVANPTVARAFQQLWHLIDRSVRAQTDYKKMPRLAKRKV